MFWVFSTEHVNGGFLDQLRKASLSGQLAKVIIRTATLPDEFVENHVRLSAINGGGSNGGFPRGTATYKRPSEWVATQVPKEIGLLHGISAPLARAIDLRIEDA